MESTNTAGFDFQGRIDRVLRALVFLGLWSNSPKLTAFDSIRVALLGVLLNLFNLVQISNFYVIRHDLSLLMLSVLVTLSGLFTNVKFYYILKYRRNIVRLRNTANRKSFQPKNNRQKELTNTTFRILDAMYLTYRVCPLITITMFGVFPLVHEPELRKLPFIAGYPFDYTKTPLYILTFTHQIAITLWATQIYVNVDSLNFTLLAIIKTQFDILGDDLRSLSEKGDFDAGKEMREKLVECIGHHKEILVFTKEVFEMLNMNIFGQFVMSTSSMCLLLLQLTVTDFNVRFLAIIFYVIAFLGELFLYCWWANEVTLQSADVPTAAFQSSWVDASASAKKDILFFIHRTQTPNILFAFDLFKVDLSNFLTILRHSYSCYTILRNFNDR